MTQITVNDQPNTVTPEASRKALIGIWLPVNAFIDASINQRRWRRSPLIDTGFYTPKGRGLMWYLTIEVWIIYHLQINIDFRKF